MNMSNINASGRKKISALWASLFYVFQLIIFFVDMGKALDFNTGYKCSLAEYASFCPDLSWTGRQASLMGWMGLQILAFMVLGKNGIESLWGKIAVGMTGLLLAVLFAGGFMLQMYGSFWVPTWPLFRFFALLALSYAVFTFWPLIFEIVSWAKPQSFSGKNGVAKGDQGRVAGVAVLGVLACFFGTTGVFV